MYNISVIRGDGIGPHIVGLAVGFLEHLADRYGFSLAFDEAPAGDRVKELTGEALPKNSLDKILGSDACLKGPVGETARDVVVYLRQRLDLFANIRPFKSYRGVASHRQGVDLVIVRENTEELYKGVEDVGPDHAVALMVITRRATERIAKIAMEMAMQRRRKVTVVHKANVVRSYMLFRDVCMKVASNYPGLMLDEMYVDNAAYQLIVNTQAFDVLLTPNMLGDILSDEVAGVVGTIGLAAGANVGENYGLFEPVHGSAPTLKPEQANPTAQILASAMMLRWLGQRRDDRRLLDAAVAAEAAVERVLEKGVVLTPDLGGRSKSSELASAIKAEIT